MTRLALLGGKPIRSKLFPAYNPIGEEEKKAVQHVMDSGNLSQFLGVWHDDFFGGPYVRQFEKDWANAIGVKHAVSINSATSGLYAAIGACGIKPGDEVIVSPYTMTASAVAPMIYGAVPVFADIDPFNFGLAPESVEQRISARTKAIVVVHIFGHPADMDGIMALAVRHNLMVIEDCAQSPLSLYKGRLTGSIGHIGIFSLNYHKHIHTGEGGIAVTNDDGLAERLQLIRNHGEAVVEAKGTQDLMNIVGYNYRLTELQAAIGVEQLKKLPALLQTRRKNALYLKSAIETLKGIYPQEVSTGCTHAYYNQVFHFKEEEVGIHRNLFVQAVSAELPSAHLREKVPLIGYGYVKPLYLQPLYQKKASICAFNCPRYGGNVSYAQGICPVTESMHLHELFGHEFMRSSMSEEDLQDVINAYYKVYENIGDLQDYARKQHNSNG